MNPSQPPRTSRTDELVANFKYDDLQGATCCLAMLTDHANQIESELLSAHGRGYGDDAFIQVQAEQLAAANERAYRMEVALDRLEKIATITHQIGASKGPHWVELAVAIADARDALGGSK